MHNKLIHKHENRSIRVYIVKYPLHTLSLLVVRPPTQRFAIKSVVWLSVVCHQKIEICFAARRMCCGHQQIETSGLFGRYCCSPTTSPHFRSYTFEIHSYCQTESNGAIGELQNTHHTESFIDFSLRSLQIIVHAFIFLSLFIVSFFIFSYFIYPLFAWLILNKWLT